MPRQTRVVEEPAEQKPRKPLSEEQIQQRRLRARLKARKQGRQSRSTRKQTKRIERYQSRLRPFTSRIHAERVIQLALDDQMQGPQAGYWDTVLAGRGGRPRIGRGVINLGRALIERRTNKVLRIASALVHSGRQATLLPAHLKTAIAVHDMHQ